VEEESVLLYWRHHFWLSFALFGAGIMLIQSPRCFGQSQLQSSQGEANGQDSPDEGSQQSDQQDSAIDQESGEQDQTQSDTRVRVKKKNRKAQKQGDRARSQKSDVTSESQDGAERAPNPARVRRFHEVLDELLAEFGYDIKSGQIKGLSNISIRKVRVSQAIPKSYEDYIETLLAERVREQSQVKIISCVPCKTRTSSLVDGKLMISSPSTNMAKLDAAAVSLGIDNFLDAVLVYHTTHMVLAIDIFDTKTKELMWARTYNSETVKSRYQKLAVDYAQVAKSRPTNDYVPEYRYLIGLGGASIPNVGGTKEDSTMLSLQVRATEKFNNRKDEFGLLFSYLRTTRSLVKAYPSDQPTEATQGSTTTTQEKVVTTATPKPFTSAIGLYGAYSHVFLGNIESYDRLRHGLHVGLGGLFTTGYLAPGMRVGWDIYLGRRFVTTFGLNYIGRSSVIIDKKSQSTKGGAGAEVILSVNL
jgi:hypothetical protein